MDLDEYLKPRVKRAATRLLGRRGAERLIRNVYWRHQRTVRWFNRGWHSSARQLFELRNRFEGERCFLFGNGPSLNETPLDLLRDEYTFGLNRIYLKFDEMGYETTFLASVNPHVLRQFGNEISETNCTKFISWNQREHVPPGSDTVLVNTGGPPRFSSNPIWDGLWEGATVTYVALQLLYHMGFQEVILLGVDHSFQTEGPAHELVTSKGKDPNHFHPDYFGEGVDWQLPDLDTSEIAYRMARNAYELDGRQVLDATINGELKVFPKVDLKDVVDEGPQSKPCATSEMEGHFAIGQGSSRNPE